MALVALLGALAACGSHDSSVEPTGVVGEHMLDCGAGDTISFPVSVVAMGIRTDQQDAIAEGLSRYVAKAGLDAPTAFRHHSVDQARWHVLAVRGDEAAVATGRWTADGPGHGAQMWTLNRDGDRWDVSGGGGCQLEPVPETGRAWSTLLAPAAGLDRTAAAPVILLTPRTCGRFRQVETPQVVETATSVTVSWAVRRPTTAVSCVGYPALREQLPLSRPLGSRTLFDGSLYPPAVVH